MTSPSEIRDILQRRIPTGPFLTLDVKLHDNICDAVVQCGSLRYATGIAIGDRKPKQVADIVYDDLLSWARKTFSAVTTEDAQRVQKFRRAARGFHAWFKSDPRARQWLNGAEIAEEEPEAA